jgi:hypothetical protein
LKLGKHVSKVDSGNIALGMSEDDGDIQHRSI